MLSSTLHRISSSTSSRYLPQLTTKSNLIPSIATTSQIKLLSTVPIHENNNDTTQEQQKQQTPQQTQNAYSKVTFLGSGKMAEALISPLISTNIQTPSSLFLNDVSCTTLDHVSSTYSIPNASTNLTEAVDGADLIVFAVKPQNCNVVFKELTTSLRELGQEGRPTLLSVVAGKPIKDYLSGCDGTVSKVARSMPNTPAQIGKGITVWTCTDSVDLEERNKIKTILNSFGKTIFVDDENFIDMATSISGSGPAYIFLLMEAMIDAGVHMGFSRDTATLLVHQTLLGSTMYAMETGEHPAILRNSVTSPAGTTASAIHELERGRFRTVIKDAIWACYRRSLEMGGKSSNIGPGRVSDNVPGGECMDEGNGNGRK